ncbi:MAG TPA: acyl-CoA dehydrogenase family protein [Streptosporangiaceae bacterium]|nr:acyl-CoA dehydrogenase family protein [Streptosporangiaceae bacterium]
MDFDPPAAEFRAEVAARLAQLVPPQPLPSVDTAEGFAQHRAFEARLADARLAAVSWPAEYGGRGASLLEWLIFEEEYHAAGGPVRVGQNGLFVLAPTLLAHGTAEQKARILPAMARADDVWAQAWSEPGAGSDLAAIRSRAVRADGGWLLSGQKTWSSRAVFADRAFGLFRSDPEAQRHRGLTYVMFDLRAPGVTVRPIPQLDGEAGFAEIFLDEVFVPDADVIGERGDGWRIAMSSAGHERGVSLRSPGRFTAAAARLVELLRRSGEPAGSPLAERVADAWIGARAYQLYGYGIASQAEDSGAGTGPQASLGKVFWSELDLALQETALDLLGPRAELRDGEDSRWLDGYLFALAGPIYAGTNEIQRSVIAERVLGMPR